MSDISRRAADDPVCRSTVKGMHNALVLSHCFYGVSACGKFNTIHQDCNLILQSAKILKYLIFPKLSKIQNIFSIWNSKISVVSTPYLKVKVAFFTIFEIYSKKCGKCAKTWKIADILRTKFRKKLENRKITLMLPSQKIKILNGEPKKFSKPK